MNVAELIAALSAMPQDTLVSLSVGGQDYYAKQAPAALVKHAVLFHERRVWVTDGLPFFEKDVP